MAAQPGASTFPDTAAVPMADGRADDHAEEVCQAGGAAGICGMIFPCITFVQNREIFQTSPHICKWSVPMGKTGPCLGFSDIYVTVTPVSFLRKGVPGKDTISSPDAPEALDIMTDPLHLRVRKNRCFLVY